jgi:purine-binding chemotaxis protein CheW
MTGNRMPDSPEALHILRQRAERLARASDHAQANAVCVPYLRLRFDAYGLFGIPKQAAHEVILSRGMAQVPCTPPFIAGVVSLRGEMIAVLDLPAFLGIGQLAHDANRPILVVKGEHMTLGLLADEIEAEVQYVEGKLDPAINHSISAHFLTGIHEGRVSVLDIDAILGDSALIVGG